MHRHLLITNIIEYSSLLLVAFIIFFPIFYSEIFLFEPSDYIVHTELAQALLEAPQTVPKSVLTRSAWHWAVVVTHKVIGKSWHSSAFIVTMISALLTVGVLFWSLQKTLSPLSSCALAISLTIAAPITFLYPLDNSMYLGYIGINTYHNPTILLLKPFTIFIFLLSTRAFQCKRYGVITILMAALITSLSVFTKPSYIICLLPSLGILTLFHVWKKKFVDWKMLLIGIVFPSVVFLIWQFFFTYGYNEGSSIVFAPFKLISTYSSFLEIKFILSIVFPLVVTAVFLKESSKDIRMQLGWMGFGIGVAFTYLLAEGGERFGHGNFIWSGQISLFILFVACVLFLSENQLLLKNRISRWLVLSSGCLHIIFGIFYYLIILITQKHP